MIPLSISQKKKEKKKTIKTIKTIKLACIECVKRDKTYCYNSKYISVIKLPCYLLFLLAYFSGYGSEIEMTQTDQSAWLKTEGYRNCFDFTHVCNDSVQFKKLFCLMLYKLPT
jgi:hypothetical protein